MLPIRFTIASSVVAPDALATWEYPDFSSFCADLAAQEGVTGSKGSTELLVQVAQWHRLYREEAAIETMSRFFCCDFDRKTEAEAMALLETLSGLSAYVYTTMSHKTAKKDNLWCFRAVLELDREYPVEEYPAVWAGVLRLLPGLDEAGKSPQLPYFLPADTGSTEQFSGRFEGRVLTVDELRQGAPLPPSQDMTPVMPVDPPSRGAILGALSAWGAYRGTQAERAQRREVAKAAKKILAHRTSIPAGEGRRHEFMIALAGYLAGEFPDGGATEHFAGLGWDLFAQGDPDHSFDKFVKMYEDFREKDLGRRTQELEKAREAHEDAVQTHLARGPITEEELRALEAAPGIWTTRAVLMLGNGHFLLNADGSYHPRMYRREELMVAARDRLSVFGDWIEMEYEDAQGNTRLKSLDRFRQEYASVLEDVWYDLALDTSHYDAVRKSLAVACAKITAQPRYHADVHEWLQMAGGDVLLDWTAALPRLREMLPALVLLGPAGSGKTIYALGAGGIWGSAPCKATDTHTRFNDEQMRRQPVTFHDEKAGDAYEKAGTSLVRAFTTESERWVEGKNLPKVRLKGFPRLIFAANNAHILDTHEDMTAEDREAFAQRLIFIDLPRASAKWCAEHRDVIQNEWLNEGRMSEHFLWLSENHDIVHKGRRFLVEGPRTKHHSALASSAGIAGEVIQWLLSLLDAPQKIKAAHAPVEVGHGVIRVTTQAVMEYWNMYQQTSRPKSGRDVGRALRSLSRDTRVKIVGGDGGTERRVNAYDIDIDILEANIDSHHITIEQFKKALDLTPSAK